MNKSQSGFSLIEVLISAAILAASILLIMALIPTGYLAVNQAGHLSTISHLGYDKIDDLKLRSNGSWTDSELTVGNHNNSGTKMLFRDEASTKSLHDLTGQDGYSITWTVANGPQMRKWDDPTTFETTDQIKVVTVTVGWKLYKTDGSTYTDVPNDQIVRVFTTIISSNQ